MNIHLREKKKVMWKPTAVADFVSKKEIYAFVFIVLILAFILFPKGRIEKLIIAEDTNIELSSIYLENLIKIETDPNLRILLAERYIRLNNIVRALEILTSLENSGDLEVRSKAKLLIYQILKRQFFSEDTDEKTKENLKVKMKSFLRESLKYSFDLKQLDSIYRESLSLGFVDVGLEVCLKALKIEPNSTYWLKEAYKQSLATGDYKTAKELLYKLSITDKDNSIKWLTDLYNLSIGTKDYSMAIEVSRYLAEIDRHNAGKYYRNIVNIYIINNDKNSAINFLESLIKANTTDRDKLLELLVSIYISNKDYDGALNVYMQDFEKERNKKRRKEIFKKIVQILLWKQDYEKVRYFLRQEYPSLIDDKETAKFVLKTALATGDIKLANEIARDLKKRYLE